MSKINLQEPQRNRNATAFFFQFIKDQYCNSCMQMYLYAMPLFLTAHINRVIWILQLLLETYQTAVQMWCVTTYADTAKAAASKK